jgi:hypothetical protein
MNMRSNTSSHVALYLSLRSVLAIGRANLGADLQDLAKQFVRVVRASDSDRLAQQAKVALPDLLRLGIGMLEVQVRLNLRFIEKCR